MYILLLLERRPSSASICHHSWFVYTKSFYFIILKSLSIKLICVASIPKATGQIYTQTGQAARKHRAGVLIQQKGGKIKDLPCK